MSATSLSHGDTAPALPNFLASPLFMHIYIDIELPIWRGNIYGEGLVLGGQPSVHLRRQGPSARQFLGFLFQNYQNWRGNACGGGAWILMSAAPAIPRQQSSRASQFWGFPVFMRYPLTQNDQIWHDNTYREGRVLGGQPCHCICTNASRVFQQQLSFL